MTVYVTCSVCGEDVGKLGIGRHAGVHRREFHKITGRDPENYGEVRDLLGPDGDHPELEHDLEDVVTLDSFAGDS